MPRQITCFVISAILLTLAFSACTDEIPPPQEIQPEAEQAETSPDAAALPPEAPAAPLHAATREVEAPDFSLPTLSGDHFRLRDQHGKVVVLNLWATWCGPCRYEIPDFNALHEELHEKGLVVVGVSLDEDGEDAVRSFAEAIGMDYPVVIDDGSVDSAYGPTAVLPTTFVIGRDGTIRRYAPGMLTKADLRPVLLALLAEEHS